MKTQKTLICGIFSLMLTLAFAACDTGGVGPVVTTPPTPSEYLPDASRWESDYDRSTGVTIAHSVDDDDVCAITVGGTAMDALPVWDNIWKAYATYKYTAVAGKTYVYTFEAWTDGADRTMNVQWYTDNVNAVYQGTGHDSDTQLPVFTITSERKTYTIKASEYSAPIPQGGTQWLIFQCANQTGTFYVKIISIDLPAAERWSTWRDPASTATISHSVNSEDVCAITVGGTAETGTPAYDNVWKVFAGYQYTAVAGKIYTYTFEAWTDGPDRTMAIQWYNDWVNDVYQGTEFENELPTFTITSERKTYNIKGKEPIPKNGVQELAFQCANQTGTYHVKILSITGIFVVIKNITITGITGKTGNAQILVNDDNYNRVAWGEGRISGNAVSFNLKQIVEGEYEGSIAYFLTDDLWYGSGSYYLELETDSQPNQYGGFDYHTTYYYTGGQADTTGRGQKYNITSATSTIPFNQFAELEGGGTGPSIDFTDRTFTLTGIPPEYNGKHAFLQGHLNMEGDGYMVGVETFTSAETYMLPVISNGSVSIPLWLNPGTEPARFSDSTIYAEIWVQIRDEPAYIINSENEDAVISQVSFYGVTFTKGSATRHWDEGQ